MLVTFYADQISKIRSVSVGKYINTAIFVVEPRIEIGMQNGRIYICKGFNIEFILEGAGTNGSANIHSIFICEEPQRMQLASKTFACEESWKMRQTFSEAFKLDVIQTSSTNDSSKFDWTFAYEYYLIIHKNELCFSTDQSVSYFLEQKEARKPQNS